MKWIEREKEYKVGLLVGRKAGKLVESLCFFCWVADYTRLIEFKVKDTELNRSVKKLSKTLDNIDKSLVEIDKKLGTLAKGKFKELTTAAEIALLNREESILRARKAVA